ncbi:methionine aminotransferase [Shewanella surugensis]|uniref:Methionine aminotransferase n=1 Tax=Shewanella surugensis TaxID=212020 RepID=A0ABT0LEJ3_9GAMM|nr:methionine aminotransferase [Shewanella surugensis]MCL1125755.1 methionine aminotransferase [Shewanella surugensis]
MNVSLNSKLPHVGPTIFSVMTQLANEHNAINLSQGFPDFQCPPSLIERVRFYMERGDNQYAPMAGLPILQQQIAVKVDNLYHLKLNAAEEVTITSGATEALFCAIQTVIQPGDEVIVFDPSYDSYEPAIILAGGKAVHLPLITPDYHIDWEVVRQSINPRTRLIIINSPHNPTGAVLTEEDMLQLSEIVNKNDLFLLSDEVYEHIIFDQQSHQSVLKYPDLYQRCFVVFSFGKTYHVTGWKVGYCIAPPMLTSEFRKVHQFVTFDTATPLQYGLADFMKSDPQHYLDLPHFYQQKRDLFCRLLSKSKFTLLPSKGTYFQLLEYSGISGLNDVDYAKTLTVDAGIAAIPISVFAKQPIKEKYLRFCFAKDDATLTKAAAILTLL